MTQPTDINTKKRKTCAQRAVEFHGVNLLGLARSIDVSYEKIRRTMDVKRFHSVKHGELYRARQAVGGLLVAAGYLGDVDDLWAEYDDTLEMNKAA